VPEDPLGAGVAALDAAGGTLPAGGMASVAPGAWFPGHAQGTSEDSWGIAFTDSIKKGSTVLWNGHGSPPGTTTELVWFFYGAEDFYAENLDSTGNNLLTASRRLIAELWEDPKVGETPYTSTQGSNNRVNLTTYTGVTEGTMLLRLQSVPGFIRVAGSAGGVATEFETSFNALGFTGGGTAYFDVVGGTMAANFDLNTISSGASLFNGVANCDAMAVFWSEPALDGPNPAGVAGNQPPYDWLLKTGGQVHLVFVPEPVTMALMGAGLAGILALRRRRGR
jgi:hypothetical protein